MRWWEDTIYMILSLKQVENSENVCTKKSVFFQVQTELKTFALVFVEPFHIWLFNY